MMHKGEERETYLQVYLVCKDRARKAHGCQRINMLCISEEN